MMDLREKFFPKKPAHATSAALSQPQKSSRAGVNTPGSGEQAAADRAVRAREERP